MIIEYQARSLNGFAVIASMLASLIVALVCLAQAFNARPASEDLALTSPILLVIGILLMVLTLISAKGLLVIQPNQARVITLFGRYRGALHQNGLRWVNPFCTTQKISQRVRNFQSERLKVNDARGNPIEIAAVIVWRVRDVTSALFEVEDYGTFVGIQSETAIRTLASHYPYDSHTDDEVSLRNGLETVGKRLQQEVQTRLELAGLEVMEARISHLAYAPEIAQTMLRRQQAEAVIAARTKLVEGAVGMVQMALKRLADDGTVILDEERKAAMVNNLMVSLVSEQSTQPIINTGTMYS